MFRSLEKVAQRSTVALAVVREIADRKHQVTPQTLSSLLEHAC
jgi:hypothetical protein